MGSTNECGGGGGSGWRRRRDSDAVGILADDGTEGGGAVEAELHDQRGVDLLEDEEEGAVRDLWRAGGEGGGGGRGGLAGLAGVPEGGGVVGVGPEGGLLDPAEAAVPQVAVAVPAPRTNLIVVAPPPVEVEPAVLWSVGFNCRGLSSGLDRG